MLASARTLIHFTGSLRRKATTTRLEAHACPEADKPVVLTRAEGEALEVRGA
jgi:hypothetical protein